MDATTMQLLLLVIVLGVVAQWKGRRFLRDWQRFRAWEAAGKPSSSERKHTNVSDPDPIPQERSPHGGQVIQLEAPMPIDFNKIPINSVPGAATALVSPPSNLWYSIEFIKQYYAKDYGRFTFPLGWWRNAAGKPMLSVAHLVNDVNCALITALQGGGKDNAILNILFTLMAMYPPEKLQIAIIDGKGGLDYIGWNKKAHVWHVARHAHDLRDAMDLITAERMRRVEKLYTSGVSKWENYTGDDMPMMVVLFSEIKALQAVMKRAEIETHLDAELSVWRGLGMRMLVGTQNSSNWSKEWRAAFEFFIAGTQPSRDEDKPNTGKDPSALEKMGVIPPSQLPSVGAVPGVMTVVHGNDGVTMRTSFIDDNQRAYWLRNLPERTPEQATQHQSYLQGLRQELTLFRLLMEEKEQKKQAVLHFAPQPKAVDEKWNEWLNDQVEPAVEELQGTSPVIALATVSSSEFGYNREELARVLVDSKQKDLPTNPVFVQACVAAFRRLGTNSAVIDEFWGKYTGDRNTVVKAALENAIRQNKDIKPVQLGMASTA